MTATTDETPAAPPPASGLATALAAMQAELPRIEKRNTANTGTYSYDYADLADVSAAVLPLLGKHGLAFTAWPTLNDDGKFVLAYSLLHESGEHRDGEYPLPDKGSPQLIGGVITYARRYCLCAVTGAAPGGDDNDAAGASEHRMDAPRNRQPTRTPVTGADHERLRNGAVEPAPGDRPAGRTRGPDAESAWQDVPPEDQPGSATPEQVGAVQMAWKKLGFKNDERTQALAAAEQIIGRQLLGPNPDRSHKNLSHNEARRLHDTVAGLKDRDALVALLAEPLATS